MGPAEAEAMAVGSQGLSKAVVGSFQDGRKGEEMLTLLRQSSTLDRHVDYHTITHMANISFPVVIP